VTIAGDEKEHEAALAALKHAAPYVRKQLGLSLNMPRTPEIHFVRDRVEEEGERVDQLLLEIEREWESQGKDSDS
jgi:ribosome-binding factor A